MWVSFLVHFLDFFTARKQIEVFKNYFFDNGVFLFLDSDSAFAVYLFIIVKNMPYFVLDKESVSLIQSFF